MNPRTPHTRDPIFQVDDRRSPHRRQPLTIAVHAIGPMHPAGLRVEVADWSARPRISMLAALRRLPAMIAAWRLRARSRRELLALDDRLLKDIGISRVEAQYEAAKPFWR